MGMNMTMNNKIAVIGSGMMTGVGIDSPSSCAAIRVKLNNFVETDFFHDGDEHVVGSIVQIPDLSGGRNKLLEMIVSPIRECLDLLPNSDPGQIALLVCVSEADRPGVVKKLDESFLKDIQTKLSLEFSKKSQIITQGRVSGVIAVKRAAALMDQGLCQFCIVAGVDTYLTVGTISSFESKSRLLSEENSDGFIPGEAGSAVLLVPVTKDLTRAMVIQGIGIGKESISIESEEPLRADGLVEAIEQALDEAGMEMADLDYRINDSNGESYVFKEASLALTRTLKKRKKKFEVWHPTECIGEIGAAIVPCTLGIALTASRKNYAPGRRLVCHYGNDDGTRAAIIMEYYDKGELS